MGAGLLGALAGLAGPVVARVLLALGFSVVTMAGAFGVITQIRTMLMDSLGQASIAGLQIAGLAGVWDALGLIFGAVTFTMTLWGLTKAVRIVAG